MTFGARLRTVLYIGRWLPLMKAWPTYFRSGPLTQLLAQPLWPSKRHPAPRQWTFRYLVHRSLKVSVFL